MELKEAVKGIGLLLAGISFGQMFLEESITQLLKCIICMLFAIVLIFLKEWSYERLYKESKKEWQDRVHSRMLI